MKYVQFIFLNCFYFLYNFVFIKIISFIYLLFFSIISICTIVKLHKAFEIKVILSIYLVNLYNIFQELFS